MQRRSRAEIAHSPERERRVDTLDQHEMAFLAHHQVRGLLRLVAQCLHDWQCCAPQPRLGLGRAAQHEQLGGDLPPPSRLVGRPDPSGLMQCHQPALYRGFRLLQLAGEVGDADLG
jgi:hypothetical protein